MIKHLSKALIFIFSFQVCSAIELTFPPEMTLSDFYRAGIYPSINMAMGIEFSARPLVLLTPNGTEIVTFGDCGGSFTFTPKGELRRGMVNVTEPVTVAEATKLLIGSAERLGVGPRYGASHPDAPAGPSGERWNKMTVGYRVPETEWTVSLVAIRSDDLAFLHAFVCKSTTRREDTLYAQAWRYAPMLQAPEEWSHLPLKGEWRGSHPDVLQFTYLVSSYDENGQLLPEFAERKKAIEAELVAQAPPPVSPPARKTTDSTQEVREAIENMDFWPWLVGGGLATLGLLRWIVVRRKV